MKYRYDVEVDHAHRSALRRIFEHDDSPGKTMVLCVSRIHSVESRLEGDPSTSVELSDGWYSIRGVLDSVLEEMVQRGTIEVGCKLCVTGAELSGLDSPSPPLEAPESAALRLHGNSTRRAQWDAKLGYQRDPRPMHVPLSSVLPAGGKVGFTSFLIARVYPLLYMEKTADGRKVFRTSRAEEQEERKFAKYKQTLLERICEQETRAFEEEMAKGLSLKSLSLVNQTLVRQPIFNRPF
jgi:breast cancer 2 susceptibility protein